MKQTIKPGLTKEQLEKLMHTAMQTPMQAADKGNSAEPEDDEISTVSDDFGDEEHIFPIGKAPVVDKTSVIEDTTPDRRYRPTKPLHEYVQRGLNIGGLSLALHRTCRVPEGQVNSLPASLGHFPVYRVADFASGAPDNWRKDGYFMPMYPQEAMWMGFSRGYVTNPKAIIIGAGNINAITGKPFDPALGKHPKGKRMKEGSLDIKLETPQNYIVVPPQPWIDGWKAEDGKIYQFVAAEMGSGQTVEGQITGKEVVGGIQLIVYDPTDASKLVPATRPHEYVSGGSLGGMFSDIYASDLDMLCCSINAEPCSCSESLGPQKSYLVPPAGSMSKGLSFRASSRGSSESAAAHKIMSMGLGRGGEISQKIYPDPHGIDVWKKEPTAVEMIYIVSSEDFKQVTGYQAPSTPVPYMEYQKKGLPWFELHDTKYGDSKGSGIFEKLKPVSDGKAK